VSVAFLIEAPKSLKGACSARVEIGRVGLPAMAVSPSSPNHEVVQRGAYEQAREGNGGYEQFRHVRPRCM
jgi:hypothetical protein